MQTLPQQTTIADTVYVAIRDAICDGSLAPGERITQDDIADRLGVSRQPVGQALLLLKAQGFVSVAGRRGVVVAPLSVETVRDIYEIRGSLDELAARLAARRADRDKVAAGREILQRGKRLAFAGDVRELVKADMEFHEFVYELSGNALIRQALASDWHHLRRVMADVIGEGSYRKTLWREHEAILEAIGEGDGERAAALSRQHVEVASAALRGKLERKLEEEVVALPA